MSERRGKGENKPENLTQPWRVRIMLIDRILGVLLSISLHSFEASYQGVTELSDSSSALCYFERNLDTKVILVIK